MYKNDNGKKNNFYAENIQKSIIPVVFLTFIIIAINDHLLFGSWDKELFIYSCLRLMKYGIYYKLIDMGGGLLSKYWKILMLNVVFMLVICILTEF